MFSTFNVYHFNTILVLNFSKISVWFGVVEFNIIYKQIIECFNLMDELLQNGSVTQEYRVAVFQ